MLSDEVEVMIGDDITLNGTALGIPENLLPLSNISWLNITMETVDSKNATTFLELDLIDVQFEDNGDYTCRLVIESDLLEGGSITVDAVFVLDLTRELIFLIDHYVSPVIDT